ncbi:MAG: c-type cytochrome [Pseudolabrys sp.]
MKKVIGLSVVLVIVQVAHAADIEAGKEMAATVCAACHGANGVSVSDNIPNLAAQRTGYLEAQLKAFKDGTRKQPGATSPTAIMSAIATQLSAENIANVAAYFASQPGAAAGAKSALLPNVANTRVTFPEGYKDSFTKYHTINFPVTKQVRYYYANSAAVAAAKAGKPLPDGSVLFAEGRGETRRRQQADHWRRRLLRRRQTAPIYGYGAGRGLGQRHSREAAERELELRNFYYRQATPAGCEPGRVSRLPQTPRQRQLHLHAEAARRSEVGACPEEPRDVRCGSKADMCSARVDVR